MLGHRHCRWAVAWTACSSLPLGIEENLLASSVLDVYLSVFCSENLLLFFLKKQEVRGGYDQDTL